MSSIAISTITRMSGSSTSCSRRARRRNRRSRRDDLQNRAKSIRMIIMTTEQANTSPTGFKPKKSVALSGTPAGNTAICTVGHSGNDLHYRGYDIADLAAHCEFEEVAYLLVYGKLPNAAELAAYKVRLRGMRKLPPELKRTLELL